MPAPWFEVVLGPNSLFHFRFFDAEGRTVVMSRGYPHKDDAFAGIRAVKEYASIPERYERRAEDGKFFFRLKSPSHKVLLEGGPYAKEEERENAISTLRWAASSPVMDKTI
jgi:uncharacterized protein YegP (UPF0339 family)